LKASAARSNRENARCDAPIGAPWREDSLARFLSRVVRANSQARGENAGKGRKKPSIPPRAEKADRRW
jgi:hypothetical protein